MIHWLTTSPNLRVPATGPDAGQRGWKLHAVDAPEKATFDDVRSKRAVCGLKPRHGWGLDAFINDRCKPFINDRCKRCEAKIGLLL